MVHHNDYLHAGHQGLNLTGKFGDECRFIMHGNIGHHVNG